MPTQLPTVRPSPAATPARPVGKVRAAQVKRPNCGSGNGGFKPGNTCGGTKRANRAAELRAARAAATTHADRKAVNQSAKAHRDYLRGKSSLTKDQAKALHAQHKQPWAEAVRVATQGKPLVGGRQSKVIDPTTHANHAPGHVGTVPLAQLHVDPRRFQFKHDTDNPAGVTDALHGVRRFDHELAGTLAVWHDPADGQTYVVNGHHRADLAKRLGESHVAVKFLDARDAREARAKGALINIAEGRGTAVDAGKFFRDSGLTREAIAEKGVSLREKVATDGLALSKLDPRVFKRVVDGDLTSEQGAIIGGGGLDHATQRELLKLVDKKRGGRDRIRNSQLRELVDTAKSARTVKREVRSLFGTDEEEQSLLLHKTKLQAKVKEGLAGEKRLFGTVGKAKNADELARAGNAINADASQKISHDAAVALGGFDLLKGRRGKIADLLNAGAERLHNGEAFAKVQRETYRDILKHMPKVLTGEYD